MNRTIRDLLLLRPYGGFRVTDVPQSEGDALIWLYNHGDGPNWTDHTNWLVTHTVADWYGVTVAGGHVTKLDISVNNGTGDISAFNLSALPSLTHLYLHVNSFSGDLSSWTLQAALAYLNLSSNGFSGDPDISSNTAMQDYRYENNVLSQADVNAVLLSIYNRRASFTDATPALNIGGSNLAPSGVYQAACPPGTGKEYAYELVNDSCGDGFNKWTVTTS